MSVDMFLKLDGIDGESIKTGFEKWIEISSFSNGVSNHSLVAHGTGSGAGKADVSSISMQKMLDAASPFLFIKCATGKHIATGNMVCRESTGDATTQVYYQYDMTEVFIDSVSWGGGAGAGKPSESLSVSAKKLVISYWPQNADGTLGSKIVKGYDQGLGAEADS